MKQLDHPNILKIYEYFVDSGFIYIVTELCRAASLSGYLKKQGLLKEQEAAIYLY